MTDKGTYRPNGSLEDQLDELNNTKNAKRIPGPDEGDTKTGLGGTADPRSSWNREEGLKHDRQRTKGEDDADVVDIFHDELEDAPNDNLEDAAEDLFQDD